MKKPSLLFLAIIFLVLPASSCSATPEPLPEADQIATVVAGTLSALPTPTAISPVASPPSLSLEVFPNKYFLGGDARFAVYEIIFKSGDATEKTGEIIIQDRSKNLVHQITGSFTFFGTTIVSNDGQGEYILLSHGTYTSRKAIVISLNDKRQAVNEFCTTEGEFGAHLFWKDFVVFNNCDIFPNRPWGAGEAPSVVAVNLKTGQISAIAKSDETHQFHVQAITGDSLQYIETSVEKEEDWHKPDLQLSIVKTYDLLSLGSGY